MKNENTHIILRGITENNLKNIDLNIPKGKLVVFTGISGSGKSSIVFDTIAAESQRQLYEMFPLFIRNKLPKIERPKGNFIQNLTTSIVVDQKPIHGNVRSTVGTITDIIPIIRLLFSRVGVPSAGTATAYSFNNPLGMCTECSGVGRKVQVDMDKLLDKNKSLNEGAIQFSPFKVGTWQWNMYANSKLFDNDKPLKDYTEKEWFDFLHGSGFKVRTEKLHEPNPEDQGLPLEYHGIYERFNRLWINRDISKLKKSFQKEIEGLLHEDVCPKCKGQRLNEAALASKINGYSIGDYFDMEIDDLIPIMNEINDYIGRVLAERTIIGLKHIADVRLGYLNLGRNSATLSGGEGQRLKLVKHLGSSLTDITFILDEPSAGLHAHDIDRLNKMLLDLRDKGNTVLVVEHDRNVIAMADEIIDIGPLAGRDGGRVVYQGSFKGLLKSNTITGQALSQKAVLNTLPRIAQDKFKIYNASSNNLKNISLDIPKGVFVTITGVAGSGKSTLLMDVLRKNNPEAIVVDQRLVGANSRSTPATYTGVMDNIRKLFADANNAPVGMFSFNSIGACPVCQGKGEILPDMVFADPIAIQCEECAGMRYSQQALQYTYKGKHIVDVLNLTITEALEFFDVKSIYHKIEIIEAVGLGYLTLGQSVSTLSGGEKQRIKLASELHKKGNIYIMDEPSTGLHVRDVAQLLELINTLVNNGNSVVVAEHHLDIIAASDWIIDMGPEGGKNGGEVVFEGTPMEIIEDQKSYTGQYLRKSYQV
ncbi:excinuclease ABC subunit UvrA [Myroides sp. N17-2]|uniref:ATP-binding cassette domain-containing protein n=1 Tax=Myroides sp. N17-2 TaxID=2030799 RepID=UPI000EFC548E|nr:excinuclease ABC subunit UvrA [Myroides sp. N17-2]